VSINENEVLVVVCFKIPAHMLIALDAVAERHKTTRSETIRRAVKEYIDKHAMETKITVRRHTLK